jgi:hypothetical protein
MAKAKYHWVDRNTATTKEEAFRYAMRELTKLFAQGAFYGGDADAVRAYARDFGLKLADCVLGDALELVEDKWTPSNLECGYKPDAEEKYGGSY